MGGRLGSEFRCEICGEIGIRRMAMQKYCRPCAEAEARRKDIERQKKRKESYQQLYEQRKRPAPEVVILPPEFTLAEVNQAARKNNMSYGQYVVAWKQGRVEAPEKFPKRGRKRGRKNGTAQERTM